MKGPSGLPEELLGLNIISPPLTLLLLNELEAGLGRTQRMTFATLLDALLVELNPMYRPQIAYQGNIYDLGRSFVSDAANSRHITETEYNALVDNLPLHEDLISLLYFWATYRRHIRKRERAEAEADYLLSPNKPV